ncbi:SMP-30/gluconolactonase/LRE family protein [Nocardioides ochotonae]|uniref:SMP-30/gluconolactonase/LRE family protein n=1 Tax=Nocardioides ochotonae TaxID=2685869 RepID=UPI00140CECF8|nr:SMP-30/gluconolactonase/LRE family protein [Nocardioides ochotonae]
MDYEALMVASAEAAAAATPVSAARLSTGYSWSEIPRWHEGTFYFSDMYNHRVLRLDEDGVASTYIDASTRTPLAPEAGSTATGTTEVVLGGLGWLPDGRGIVVSMHERLLLVWDGATLEQYADLREVATSSCNDMVVDADGRAYVTQLGYDLFAGEEAREAGLIVVEPDRTVRDAGVGTFQGANGIGLSADAATLITAENDGCRISALDRGTDGALSGRRVWAELPWMPDGIAIDGADGVWAGLPGSGWVGRFEEGGKATHAVQLPIDQAMGTAVALGGADRSTLFIACGMEVFDWAKSREEGLGSIWTAPAPYGAGSARP